MADHLPQRYQRNRTDRPTVHHADVVAIEGDSYSRRDAETDKKSRRGKKQTA